MRTHGHHPADRNGSGAAPRRPVKFDEAIDEPIDQQELPETEGLPQFLRQLRELGEYVSYYLAAQADGAKLGLRNALINMSLAALAFLVLVGLSLGAIWFALNG